MMRQSGFQFRLGPGLGRGPGGLRGVRVGGLPGLLVLVIGGVVVAGVVALVLFLGAFIAMAGLVAAAGTALYVGARRWLGKGVLSSPPRVRQMESRPVSGAGSAKTATEAAAEASPMSVREIEVEVLPDRSQR